MKGLFFLFGFFAAVNSQATIMSYTGFGCTGNVTSVPLALKTCFGGSKIFCISGKPYQETYSTQTCTGSPNALLVFESSLCFQTLKVTCTGSNAMSDVTYSMTGKDKRQMFSGSSCATPLVTMYQDPNSTCSSDDNKKTGTKNYCVGGNQWVYNYDTTTCSNAANGAFMISSTGCISQGPMSMKSTCGGSAPTPLSFSNGVEIELYSDSQCMTKIGKSFGKNGICSLGSSSTMSMNIYDKSMCTSTGATYGEFSDSSCTTAVANTSQSLTTGGCLMNTNGGLIGYSKLISCGGSVTVTASSSLRSILSVNVIALLSLVYFF